jgi:uncharacterized protein YdeI (YjbR/CyaY-like superfamily)
MTDPHPTTPDDLAATLAERPEAERRWWTWSPSHRQQYVSWIEEAKRPETRARRAARSVEMIAESQRRTQSPSAE